MAHFFFNILYGIIRFTPYPVFHGLAWLTALVLYLCSKRLRQYALESLTIAYGDTKTQKEKECISRAAFFNLTLGLADLVFHIARPGRACDAFAIEGIEHLKAAQDAGHGAVVALAHYGPFAAMLFKFLYEGFTVRVVMRPPRSKALRDDLVSRQDTFAPQPVYSTPLRACVVACFAALKRNEIVAMPIDQNYGGPGRIFVDFFGRKAATAAGPAAYAFKTGAALMSAFAVPAGRGRWRIVIEPMAIDRTLPEGEAVRKATQGLTARVEDMIRQRPQEWAWMHRRWKCVPRENEAG